MMSSQSQPCANAAEQPFYVKEALKGLTRAQKKYVIDGCLHGDVTMETIRALQQKALFYLRITSPNGRCGHMELTPLGVTIQGILKARAALSKASPQKAGNEGEVK